MRSFVREYFTFSSGQRIGLIALISIFLATCLFFALREKLATPEQYDQTRLLALEQQVDALWEGVDSASTRELSRFDPNLTSAEEWKSMGIDDKVIRNITNYKAKGGKFYRKEDVLRIYGFTKEDYLRLAPYIWIQGDRRYSTYVGRTFPDHPEFGSKDEVRIEINSADSATWTRLNGIGPVLASRIVKYRDRFAGFKSVDDVSKVYGVSLETFDKIQSQLYIDPSLLANVAITTPDPKRTIEIVELSTADSAALEALPGLGGYSARSIIVYRKRLGGFVSLEQLREIGGIRAENIEKFLPYVSLDTSRITKLSLNTWSHTQLSAHPYIGKSLADFIITYRMRTPFMSVEELKKSFLVDPEKYKRLRPYLAL